MKIVTGQSTYAFVRNIGVETFRPIILRKLSDDGSPYTRAMGFWVLSLQKHRVGCIPSRGHLYRTHWCALKRQGVNTFLRDYVFSLTLKIEVKSHTHTLVEKNVNTNTVADHGALCCLKVWVHGEKYKTNNFGMWWNLEFIGEKWTNGFHIKSP